METKDGTYYFFKADILRGELTYSTDKHLAANLTTISVKRANAVIEMNKRGERPESLSTTVNEEKHSADLLEQENIARFDNSNKKKRRKGAGGHKNEGGHEHRETKREDSENRSDNQTAERGEQEHRPERRYKRYKGNNRGKNNENGAGKDKPAQ